MDEHFIFFDYYKKLNICEIMYTRANYVAH